MRHARSQHVPVYEGVCEGVCEGACGYAVFRSLGKKMSVN